MRDRLTARAGAFGQGIAQSAAGRRVGPILFDLVSLATLAIVIAPERLHKAPTAPPRQKTPRLGASNRHSDLRSPDADRLTGQS